jgi:hypothetical protein
MSRITARQVGNCQVDQVGMDSFQGFRQIGCDAPPFPHQVDQIDLMPRIDIPADAGNAVIGHMEGHFMDHDGYHIRHGDQRNFHKTALLSISNRVSAIRPDTEKASPL